MYLTLEVVSPQAVSLGAKRRQVVGPRGLTIGRTEGNDWVIPDRYVSREHARISFRNGGFFVEGLGRNPIAISNAGNAIPSHQPYQLKNGDHLFIDQYDILIAIFQGEPPGTAAPVSADDPFGIADAEAAPAASAALVPDVWDNELPGGVSDTSELDPMAALAPGQRENRIPDLPPVNLQPDSPLRDPFAPPPVRARPAPEAGSGGIPDSWDQPSAVSARGTPAAAAPSGIPSTWDQSVVAQPVPPPEPPPRPPPRQVAIERRAAPAPAPIAPAPVTRKVAPARPVSAPPPPPASPPLVARPVAVASAAAPTAAGQPAPSAAAEVRTDLAAGFAELLRGAGVAERSLSPEVMQELGQVFRIVVQGVMDVLRARSDIKSQFRLPMTRMQAKENNPLKFSPNVESVLHTLLVQRNPGYLTTVEAFEEAFEDIRNHQMAVLEGLRVAFNSMLEAFDPEELQKEFDEGGKRGGLLGRAGAKSRYWELYAERFARLGGDPDDTFRRLFGDVFAQAYERQLERLKGLAGQRDKN